MPGVLTWDEEIDNSLQIIDKCQVSTNVAITYIHIFLKAYSRNLREA